MKIAFFTDHFYPELGGVQDSLLAITAELGRRGHEVVVLAPSAVQKDFERSKVPFQEIDLGPRVRIYRVPSIPFPSPTLQSRISGPLLSQIPFLKDWRPDIIHTESFYGIGLAAVRVAKKYKIPLVATNHMAIGEFFNFFPVGGKAVAALALKYVSFYYSHCGFVSVPCQAILDEMRAWGCAVPGMPVSNPIDLETFSPSSVDSSLLKKRWNLSPNTYVFAGRFGGEKYVDLLIRALPFVRREIPDAMLALAGHGSEQGNLENLARELGVSDAVRFVGTLGKHDVADLFRASEVFAVASTSETQCMSLIQAMGVGLPAVGVQARALPEYIKEGVTGTLVSPGDHKALAEKIIFLFKNQNIARQWGSAAHESAQKFSVGAIADTWEEIYKKYGHA
jgi:1,2-diacylglycerol 3-alpha-glucosyltransferase